MAVTAPRTRSTHSTSLNGEARQAAPTGPTKGYQTAAHLTAVGPYTLHAGTHLFGDWRFIEAGTPTYYDAEGTHIHYTDPTNGRNTEMRPVWYRGEPIGTSVDRP